MDSLTQIVLGAAVGEVVLGKKLGNKAILWGAIAGTLPDMDVYLSLFLDPLRSNELHRGFTHSIVFSLVMAPLLGWLAAKREKILLAAMLALIIGFLFVANSNPVVKGVAATVFALFVFISYRTKIVSTASTRDWSRLFFWSLVTHPLLDCHTTWGTQLLWPLPYKIAYNNIFVVDFFYTLPFLICVLVAMSLNRQSKLRSKWNWAGIIISSTYMLWSISVKWHVHQVFTDNLVSKEITYSRLTTAPTPLNTFLWMGSADGDSAYHVGLYSIFDSDQDIEFSSMEKDHHLLGDLIENDKVQRLRNLAKEWYVVRNENDTLKFYDARFGPLFDGLSEPRYMFGYSLIEKEGEITVGQDEPPTEKMGDAMNNLIERIKGE